MSDEMYEAFADIFELFLLVVLGAVNICGAIILAQVFWGIIKIIWGWW